MSETTHTPVFYFKHGCPFCMKVRLYLLEAGLMDSVEIRDFVVGTAQEDAIRAELAPHVEKLSFPAARVEADHYIADSDQIIAHLANTSGRAPDTMPVLKSYVEGPLQMAMALWKENQELKAAVAAAH